MRINDRIKALMIVTLCIGSSVFLLSGCGKDADQEAAVQEEQGMGGKEEMSSLSEGTGEETNILEVDGTVKLLEKKELFLEFPATIEAVYIQENDIVQKGESLLSFSYKDYQEEMEQTRAEIDSLQNEVERYQNHIDTYKTQLTALEEQLKLEQYYKGQGADPEIKTLEIRLESSREAVKMAKDDYEASKQLYEAGGTSQKDVDTLEQLWKTKENDTSAIENSIQTLETARDLKIVSLTSQIKQIEVSSKSSEQEITYNLNATMIKLEQAKRNLASMEEKLTKAGIKGDQLVATDDDQIVSKIKCAGGTRISGSGNTLIELVNRDSIVIELEVPVEEGYKVQIDQEVIIQGEEEGSEIKGNVSTILQKVVDDDDDYIPVQVKLQDNTTNLMQNQRVKAQIMIE